MTSPANDAEWRNPENWSDPVIGLYFSKKDTRTWVPKRIPWLGWTPNLAHRAGACWLLGIFLGLIAVFVTTTLLAVAAR